MILKLQHRRLESGAADARAGWLCRWARQPGPAAVVVLYSGKGAERRVGDWKLWFPARGVQGVAFVPGPSPICTGAPEL